MTTGNAGRRPMRVGEAMPEVERRARNTSAASENKIHDDEVAKEYGFRGGLVPGATTYAYAASHLARVLGFDWVASGRATVALVRPVYEGEVIRIGGTFTDVQGDASRGDLAVDWWVDGQDGVRRAAGTAAFAWGEDADDAARPAFADPALAPRAPDERGPISAATAPVGVPLPPVPLDAGPDAMIHYLDGIDNDDPLFRVGSPHGGPLVHPGWYPNAANQALARNFRLGPWIHTHSDIRHLALAPVGGIYRAYAQIVDAFEKRGHEYVTADVLIADADDRPVARVLHTAIVVVAKRKA